MARLIESLATTAPLAELFSDHSVLQALLDFEVALARAEAHVGIVPHAAAESIAASAKIEAFDLAALSRDMLRAGTIGVPLVKALIEQVRAKDGDAARYVHWGATSQDVADTALILLLKRAQPILAKDISRLEHALAKLSQLHKDTVMLGRTLMQGAPPVTFGLKATGWLGAVHRSRKRIDVSFAEALILQFGGASGTLAMLGEKGSAVAARLASELGLACPAAPWHTHRDRLAHLLCDCAVLTGSLGKIARDITLLMQNEVAEVSEPGGLGRGGSSTMPQKRNPIASTLTLAAAQRVPGEIAAFLSAMVQEHERGAGGWQAEWPIIASVIQATGLAVASMAETMEGLSVDAERMRANIDATHGAVFAERATMLLAPKLGRDAAHKLIEKAARESSAKKKNLSKVLSEMPEVAAHIEPSALDRLEEPEQYLGSAEAFRQALLSSALGESEEADNPRK